MPSLRATVKHSNHWAARLLRGAVYGARNFTLPVPRPVVVPLVKGFIALRAVYYWLVRVFVCEPFFKAQCARYGDGVRTGTFLHWIMGAGDIVVGDRVHVEGKVSFIFASILPERPRIELGDDTYVSHLCTFIAARRITVGRHVHIANGVTIFDSPGHPLDAERRTAGMAPDPEDIRAVCIGDKVWIGTGARIFPGVTVGEGSVIGMGAIVTRDVPPYSLAAGNPARVIRSLRPARDGHDAPTLPATTIATHP
ncbi:transferase hexapeptide repeat containing protein [Gemmatirosa kalamazoonensis]|uniref:Transferase hexapeptide repeat containing protein n=1 Tax=Gemmatirosa kalamazoonensis TaxID=861299 RepID=W0RG00_9BACT|nr:acyltransferase [Gemmatirosa kalamazoonensis]AHG90039.1 transferase hexapeptide repeat containing protein [Gemmatirosa kalamazoonensis]